MLKTGIKKDLMEKIIPSGLLFLIKNRKTAENGCPFYEKRIYYVKAAFVENFEK